MLSEISQENPCGALSIAADIIQEAQSQAETVAWVAGTDSVFFPPDFSDRGIDLYAVAVVRSRSTEDALTAAEWLLRSCALGLVLVDLKPGSRVTDAALGRLQKLAERAAAAVIFLTQKPSHDLSLGSRISLRGCVSRPVSRPAAASRIVELHTSRDKRAAPGSRQRRNYDGPPGVR